MKKTILVLSILALLAGAAFGQAADRAYYVSDAGNDENNGRSEETPFKTLAKAFETAKNTSVKKIIICGESPVIGRGEVSNTGDAEILVTAADNSKEYQFELTLSGKSNVRFENIRKYDALSKTEEQRLREEEERPREERPRRRSSRNERLREEEERLREERLRKEREERLLLEIRMRGRLTSISAGRGAQITIGSGVILDSVRGGDSSTITIQGNAKISYIESSGSKLLIKDDVEITADGDRGAVSIWGECTIQDNVKITGSGSRRAPLVDIRGGNTILKGNVRISGNTHSSSEESNSAWAPNFRGGGIAISGGNLLIQDNVAITGNTANGGGGGIYVSAPRNYTTIVVIKGNAVISGNRAKQGGGIYIEGTSSAGFSDLQTIGDDSAWENVRAVRKIISAGVSVSLEEQAAIKENTATEGGGVYVNEGSVQGEYTVDPVKKTAVISYKAGGFVMAGGVITGNKADYGAGVYVTANSLTVQEQQGGYDRTFLQYTVQNTGRQIPKPAFTFNAGTINGNTAEYTGGGVFVKNKGAYVPGRGTVNGNTAGDGEGNDVYTP